MLSRSMVLKVFMLVVGTTFFIWAPPPLPAGDAGIVGADFLRIPAGPRPASMGGAYAALSGDGFGMFWNPAGISRMDRGSVSASHQELFSDLNVKNQFLGLTYPFSARHSLAFSGRFLYTTDRYRSEWGDGSRFTNYSGSFSTNYAYGGQVGLSYGVGLKFIQEQLANYKAKSYALDLGLHYRSPRAPLQLGFSMQNLGPEITFIEVGDPLPLTFRGGWSYDFNFLDRSLILSNDLVYYQPENITSLSAGLEFKPFSYLALRSGYSTSKDFDESGQFHGGFGVKARTLTVDYSFSPRENLQPAHVLSMTVKFGARPEQSVYRERPEVSEEALRREPGGLEKDLEKLIPEQRGKAGDGAENLNTRAREYYETGSYQKALRLWEQSLSRNPDQPGVLRLIARTYYKLGDYERARKYLEQAGDKR